MRKKIIMLAVFLVVILVLSGCGIGDRDDDDGIFTKPKDPNEYKWSTGIGPYHDVVSYATSKDLVSWEDSQAILAQHASVPGAIIKDGVIYVYFVDVSVDDIPEQLGLIKSSDNGNTWSEKQIVSIEGLGEKVAVDPDPLLLEDGKIRLYYFDINVDEMKSKDFKIYSAISDDGLNFVEEDGVRFSNPGTLDPDVLKDGDSWYLYTGSVEDPEVVLATSSDGLNFQKSGVAFSGSAVPNVFQKGSDYYLFTAGIEIMKSDNPEKFTKRVGMFQSDTGVVTADPSVLELPDGTYIMFYKTSEKQPGGPGDEPVPGMSNPEPPPPPENDDFAPVM